MPLLRSRFARERVRSAGSAPADQINPDVIAVKGELRIDVGEEGAARSGHRDHDGLR